MRYCTVKISISRTVFNRELWFSIVAWCYECGSNLSLICVFVCSTGNSCGRAKGQFGRKGLNKKY